MAAAVQVSRLRFPMALVGALGITMVLYGFLHVLISRVPKSSSIQPMAKITFTPLHPEREIEPKKPEKPQLLKPEVAPPQPDFQVKPNALNPDGGAVTRIQELVEQQTESLDNLQHSDGDRDEMAVVRTEPNYPMQARQRGIGGWVAMEFTISAVGTVKDAEVVASEPSNVFDRAALNAVRKWKYNPKVRDGQPIERPGVKVRLDFEMEH